MTAIYTVDVDWLNRGGGSWAPSVTNTFHTRVNVAATSLSEARLIALQMVACRPECDRLLAAELASR